MSGKNSERQAHRTRGILLLIVYGAVSSAGTVTATNCVWCS